MAAARKKKKRPAQRTGRASHTQNAQALAIVERRAKVAAMITERKTQVQIAKTLGVNQATISRDLAAVLDDTRELTAANLDNLRETQLRRYLRDIRFCFDEYEASKKPKTIKTVRRNAKGEAFQEVRVEEPTVGDPRFLELAHKASVAIDKLVGSPEMGEGGAPVLPARPGDTLVIRVGGNGNGGEAQAEPAGDPAKAITVQARVNGSGGND